MNNILLVGNGFDLAHGLHTSYNDFLFIMKEWNFFYIKFKEVKEGRKIGVESIFYKYLIDADRMDEQNISKLGEIIQKNSWVKYYCRCEAEIDKWIDFEREIYPVMELFEFIFNAKYNTSGHGGDYGVAHIDRNEFTPNVLRIARLWEKYIDARGAASVNVKQPYASMQYGILKKKILEDLRKEFDEFIEAFELYLHEFVYKRNDVKLLKQIKELEIGSIISFNYTLTEQLYGIDEKDVHHIHGMIRENLCVEMNNMVVGVNEQDKQNIDFIYFVKYFQRIQKASGTKYKEFEGRNLRNVAGVMRKDRYSLYIYGHSLDETDEDILKYLIGDVCTTESYSYVKLKPAKVVIFYYDAADYEHKVINLIKLYGRSIVEECMENKIFEFVPTSSEVWSE